jgi:hypothetical protein
MTTPDTKRDEDADRRYIESLALVLTQLGMQRMRPGSSPPFWSPTKAS